MKISVILPSLNVEKYIEECINSVCKQTINDIEIICVDAGSTDKTLQIIENLALTDNRIKVIHSDRKSYGYQVNLGLSKAKGEYIAILETDDYVAEDMYGKLFSLAKENNCDFVKADYEAFWTQDTGERFFIHRKNLRDNSLYNKVIKPINYCSVFETDWYLWTGIYRRDFLLNKDIRFSETDGASFQDIGFIYKTLVAAERAFYTTDSYYRYCIDREDASSNSGKGIFFSKYEFSKLLDKENKYSEDELKALYIRMIKSFVSLNSNSDGCFRGISLTEYTKCSTWFKESIGMAFEKNTISKEDITKDVYEKYFALGSSEEVFRKVYSDRLDARKTIDSLGGVVIFGCGNIGYLAYKWAKSNALNISGFLDNNKALWDQSICGLKIYNPSEAKKLSNKNIIMIANDIWAMQIEEQLLEYGVEKEKIVVFV